MIQIQNNKDLKPYNTFGLNANAKQFAEFKTVDDLSNLRIEGHLKNELTILGGGSNILLTKDIDHLVLLNSIDYKTVISESEEGVLLEIGGGVVWHDLVLWTLDQGYFGMENLSLIPGSVGASPMQNIGAYGVEIKDFFHSLKAFHIASGEVHEFNNAQCEFGYRESVFKRKLKGQYIIVSVQYKLNKSPNINTSYGVIEKQLEEMGVSHPTPKDVSNAVIAIRQSKLPDPKEIGNSGSFFKNPVVTPEVFAKIQKEYPNAPNYPAPNGQIKMAAGWLIDQAGWKGKTFDNYGVHKMQALVLVNYGGATGAQIYELSSQIIDDIQEKFGITLEREVNVL